MGDNHVAILLSQSEVRIPRTHDEMGKLKCEGCEAECAIFHFPAFSDSVRAKEEMEELQERLRDDHRNSRKHENSVEFDLRK